MKLSFGVKLTILAIVLMIIPIVSGYFAYTAVIEEQSFHHQMMEVAQMELYLDQIMADLHEMQVSVDTFRETGSDAERDSYSRARGKLDLDHMAAMRALPSEDRLSLAEIESNFTLIDTTTVQLLALDDPANHPFASRLMEEFNAPVIRSQSVVATIKERLDRRLAEMFLSSDGRHRQMQSRLVVSGLFLLMVPVLFWFAGVKLARPVYAIVKEAERLGAGDWSNEVKPQEGPELSALGNTLEEMRRNLIEYRSEVTGYRETLERQVDMLQAAILPHMTPEVEGFDIATFYHSATKGLSIGGDFYDFVPLHKEGWGIVIGDVAGRGLEAAAYTALTRLSLRGFALEYVEPAVVMGRLNRVLVPQTPPATFITMWYGVWDPENKSIVYSNGGHPAPLLVRASTGEVVQLDGENLAVGIWEDTAYKCSRVSLEPGDTIVLYTDGLFEARAKSGEMVGDSRLARLCAELVGKEPAVVAQSLGQFCINWAAGGLDDDVAIVVLKCL